MNEETKVKARNVSELVFPRDYGSNLSNLKKEVLRSISHLNGNVEKYKAFKETMALLAEFAETRMRVQLQVKKSDIARVIASQAVDSAADRANEQEDAQDAVTSSETGS